MEIELFQKSFKNQELNLRPYLLVVSIFIFIIFIIIGLNNKIEDYYITEGSIKDKEVRLITSVKDLNNIVNNKKVKIEKDIFTYEVKKIEDYIVDNNIYKEVVISIKDYNNLIDNNVVDLKIIVNKTSIISYLIKTLKGE